MSWIPDKNPVLGNKRSCDAVEIIIVPWARDERGYSGTSSDHFRKCG